ncbi:restriction endonuclease [Rugamonas rivuli]|uniref:Restriction endonuclease type IV Mrr domain-containing protein n=1 Tax=Rugamonas rivuli TaxID=2743358 RepID=A0A843SJ78_9BURK|nr:restriction endonuclease [Rugamonas rivuli]MQA22233.1 hypothetical protein [Rugamonas rivuli]
MSILDFREIPTANAAERNKLRRTSTTVQPEGLDAFEKFAEEFFEKIKNFDIIQRVARGQDLSVDLIAVKDGKRHLISCKHYAHGDKAVGPGHETDITDALLAHHCVVFVGFYSTSPTNGLVAQLDKMGSNDLLPFSSIIFKSSDIESALLDKDDASGWLLAARYFPKSFGNLYRRFVVPIQHYKDRDVTKTAGGFELHGPGGGITNGTKEELLRQGNEYVTNQVHIAFFREALKEFIDIFPSYFKIRQGAVLNAIGLDDISPDWNAALTTPPRAPAESTNEPIIVCAVWSFWDAQRAMECYLNHRKVTNEGNLATHQVHLLKMHSKFQAFASVPQFAAQGYRNILARLVAFAPAPPLKQIAEPGQSLIDASGDLIPWTFAKEAGLEFLNEKLFR